LERTRNSERRHRIGDRLRTITKFVARLSLIPQGNALAVEVAHLACTRVPLLEVLNRFTRLAENAPNVTKVVERATLAAAIPDLARDRKRLLIVLDRLIRISELDTGDAKAA
jgi:hypothetical protein